MRHVNPIRQSGPLPSYYGTYTMEDMKKLFDQFTMGKDINYCQMDVDEVMRRVPGVSHSWNRLPVKKWNTLYRWDFRPMSKSDSPISHITSDTTSFTLLMVSMLPDKSSQTRRDKKSKYFGILCVSKICQYWMSTLLLCFRLLTIIGKSSFGQTPPSKSLVISI